jgi:hypothetical protein
VHDDVGGREQACGLHGEEVRVPRAGSD